MSKPHPNGTRVKFTPDPRRDDCLQYAGHTGSIIYYTSDGFYRVSWDDPIPDNAYFNLGRVFRPDSLTPVNIDNGPKCQQPNGCEGVSLLTKEENHTPNLCRICKVVLCDTCAAWCEGIPRTAFMPPALVENGEMSEFACGCLCSDHFNEDWVDAPKPPAEEAVFHLKFNGFTAEQLERFIFKLRVLANTELDGSHNIERVS